MNLDTDLMAELDKWAVIYTNNDDGIWLVGEQGQQLQTLSQFQPTLAELVRAVVDEL